MNEIAKFKVVLEGLVPIMFNRFIDHSKEVRPPEQKFYLDEKNQVVLPAENLMSFLCGSLIPGCIKKFEGKKSGDFLDIAYSHISFTPNVVPFLRKGKPIVFKTIEDTSLWGIKLSGGITKSGASVVKQEAQPRPYLKTPWGLELTVTLVKNPMIDETKLYNYFVNGGIVVALGTFRPMYGRFSVKKWEQV